MYRNLLPLILTSLGFHIMLFALSTPLFEWRFGEVVTDFPSGYEIHTPSFTTLLGNSLNNKSYYGRVYVTKEGLICPYESMTLIVRRPQNNETFERIMLTIKETYIPWLEYLSAIAVFLAMIYVWWYAVWYKRPVLESIGLTVLGAFVYLLLSQIARPFLGRIGPTFGFYGTLDCYHGEITFTIDLSKILFEMPFILLVGILLQMFAFRMIVRQILNAVNEAKVAKN